MISIEGLDHADVLAALYEKARPQGLGVLHYIPGGISKEEAETLLAKSRSFDYLHGRVMKIRIPNSADENAIYVELYDRDNGQGAAQVAIDGLRARKGA